MVLLQSTIVLREFTHIAYALLFSRQSDCDSTHAMLYFFMFTPKNILCKNSFSKNTF